MVTDFPGTVLRYGQFYGPGTAPPEIAPNEPRSVETARHTVEALEQPPGILVITDGGMVRL